MPRTCRPKSIVEPWEGGKSRLQVYLYLSVIRGLPRATAKVLAVATLVITIIIAGLKILVSHPTDELLGPINVAGSLKSLLSIIIASGTLHAVSLSCVRALRASTHGILLHAIMLLTTLANDCLLYICIHNAVWYSKDRMPFGPVSDDR
jgi:hypothetical protein